MTTLTRPLNRQEVTFYFWFAALLWLGIVVVAVIVWAVASASTTRLIRLGIVADFPPRAQPYYVPVKRDGLPSAAVFIVHTGAQIIALNAENASNNSLFNCSERVVWVPTNQRFEGPCTGNKFALDGKRILSPFNSRRGLESFPLEVRDGEIWIDLSEPIPGKEAPSPKFTPRP
ncbi:MAG: hypothetical protein JNL09_01915 [Anaerolineales bacterium]|nr:hypothetical protein [Anaerolineales bacterium]